MRKRFSIITRRKAAGEVIGGASIKEVARKYRASETSVRRWRDEEESGQLDLKGLHPPSYGDSRMLAYCIHCGGHPDTEDHNPSYVFLDQPYPEELAVVGVCDGCNNSFSPDEPYLAALIEAARTGDAGPSKLWRPKIRGVVKNDRKLQATLNHARYEDGGVTWWKFDEKRASNVISKLARGHAAFELHDFPYDEPVSVGFAPLHLLHADQRKAFESPPRYPGLPEVGSRALHRMFQKFPSTDEFGWVTIQKGRYRYVADGSGNNATVRIVFSEYLGAEVTWQEL